MGPSAIGRWVTSVISIFRGQKSVSSDELVPFKEQAFAPSDVATPAGVAMALHRTQRAAIDATQSARTLPVLGGTYWPNITFVGQVAQQFAHGVSGTVAFLTARMRATASSTVAPSVIEVGQDASTGRIQLVADVDCICDVWFYPQPVAKGSVGAGSTTPPVTPPTPTPSPPFPATGFGGDLAAVTASTQEVVGILSNPLPPLSAGLIGWTGSAWAFVPIGSIFTPGADIAGNGASTSTLQYVSSISFDGTPPGGIIAINGYNTALNFTSAYVGIQYGGSTMLSTYGGAPSAYNVLLGDPNATSSIALECFDNIVFVCGNEFLYYNTSNPSEVALAVTLQPYVGGTSSFVFQEDSAVISFSQNPKDEDVAPALYQFVAQDAWTGATVNTNGGTFRVVAGAGLQGLGVSGRIQFFLRRLVSGVGVDEVAMEACEPVIGQRVAALGITSSGIGSSQLGSGTGDGIVHVNTVITAPTSSPAASAGTSMYSDGTSMWINEASGGLRFQIKPSAGFTAFGGDLAAVDATHQEVVGLLSKALPSLPGSDEYLHYTGSGWAFSALPSAVTLTGGTDISVGTGPNYTVAFTGTLPTVTGSGAITVTGGPAYTVSLTVAPAKTLFYRGNMTRTGAPLVVYGRVSAAAIGSNQLIPYAVATSAGWSTNIGGGSISMNVSAGDVYMTLAGSNTVQPGDEVHFTCALPPPQSINSQYDVYTTLYYAVGASLPSFPGVAWSEVNGAGNNNGATNVDAWITPTSSGNLYVLFVCVNVDVVTGTIISVLESNQSITVEIWR